jgi:hypothetical protein
VRKDGTAAAAPRGAIFQIGEEKRDGGSIQVGHRLLKAMGFAVPAKRRGLALNLARYRESDRKAAIDWSDSQARAAELTVLVADADAALTLASEQRAGC